MKYSLLFLSIIFVMISACKKVETPKSDDELVREGNWRLDTATVAFPIYKNETDLNALTYDTIYAWQDTFPSCKKDDYLVFRDHNEGGLMTGQDKCPNGEVDEVAFTWGLTDKSSKMYLYGAGAKDMFFGYDNINADVKEFSDSKIVLAFETHKFVQTSGWFRDDTLRYIVTLKKK